MPRTRPSDAGKYVSWGIAALLLPFAFLFLEISWRADPAPYDSVMNALARVRAVQVVVVAALMVLPLVGAACGLMVLQCGRKNLAGAALGLGGIVLLVLMAALRPS